MLLKTDEHINTDEHITPDVVARGFDEPPQPTPVEPQDVMPPGRPSVLAPASIRLVLWLVYLVRFVTVVGLIRGFSRIGRRFVVWFLMLYLKAYGLVAAVTGGRVEDDEFDERMAECLDCPGVEIEGSKLYCGPCGCPKWFMAELTRKNRWRKHYCPEERHARTDYPQYVTVSVSGCGQAAFKVPGGRAAEGGGHG